MNQELQELQRALQEEHFYSKNEFVKKSNLPFNERIALGIAFPPLPVKSMEEEVVSLRIPTHIRLHDGIEQGDLVSVFPPSAQERSIEGICSYKDAYSIEIRIQQSIPPSLMNQSSLCVQLRFDERSFLLQEKGLEQAITHDSPLKKALLGNWELIIQEESPTRPCLNQSQSIAIDTFLKAENLSIIHGPPGTGKTHTIAQLCKEVKKDNKTIWLLADSNAAVDHLCSTLTQIDLDVLRLGSRYRIAPSSWKLSIYHRLQEHPFAAAVQKLEKEIRTVSGKEKGNLVRQKRALQKNMRIDIIRDAPIIASTLGTMHKEAPFLPSPDIVIIDEASQVTDPSIWTIIPYISKLLLVGDPHQLGPVVLSQNKRLSSTLLKRKMEEQTCPMLNVQHRMHHNIHALVQHIYGSLYIPHPNIANRTLHNNLNEEDSLISKQVIWIDTTGAEEGELRDPVTHSLYNKTEIEWTVRVFQALQKRNINNIGVIAPYSAQVQRLRSVLPNADINTVTAFQGQERDVIICSFVRANFDGELGFVADIERLTVSITRPQKLLIMIGDASLLSQSPIFSTLFSILDEQNAWLSIWDTPDW